MSPNEVAPAGKLVPPAAPRGAIARPRLFEALDEGIRHTLTLLAAPAGMGKTVLVETWLERTVPPGPVAWVSLDRADDERTRFWRLVVAALAGAGGGPGLQTLAGPGPFRVDDTLPALVEALSARRDPVLLVIDDLHEIQDRAILEDIALLLRVPPPALHIVATTRRVPRIGLQKLRMAGAVLDIGADELAFTLEEAGEVLRARRAGLSEADIEELWRRTEGWPAGLVLAAMTIADHPDPHAFITGLSGDEDVLASYLLQEVVGGLPSDVVSLLMETSVVDQVSGELADAMTGSVDGGVVLEDLHRRGLLVDVLDGRHEWYRYHPLLRGFLRGRLRREAPERIQGLHRHAARWLADNGRPCPGIRQAIAAADLGLLHRLLAEHGFELVLEGLLPDLVHALGTLGPAGLRREPWCGLFMAIHELDGGRIAGADDWLAGARAASDDDLSFRVLLEGVELYRSRVAGTIDDAEQLMDRLREQARDASSAGARLPAGVSVMAGFDLGVSEMWAGRGAQADALLTETVDLARADGLEYLEHTALPYLAVLRLFEGRIADGKDLAATALAIGERRGWSAAPANAMALGALGTAELIAAELSSAERHLEEARRVSARSPDLPLRAYVGLELARLRTVQGRADEALRLAIDAGAAVSGTPFAPRLEPVVRAVSAGALVALGRCQEAHETASAGDPGELAERAVAEAACPLADGDPAAAATILDRWFEAGQPSRLPTMRLHALLLRAVAHGECGDPVAAAVDDALECCDATGVWLPFLEVGPVVAPLLDAYPADGPRAELAAEAARIARSDPSAGPPAATVPEPDEPLSERELAVLRLLPTMLTNREIADQLYVSVNTVKTHLKQVYRKLGAADRADAVSRARRLGLIALAI